MAGLKNDIDNKNRNNSIDNLYRRYVHDLYSYALHLGFDSETSKDAIHDIFYKLCINEKQLDSVANVRYYLLCSLKNRLLDIYKQRKNMSQLPSDSTNQELPFTIHITIEDTLIQSEEEKKLKTIVGHMLQSLTSRQREIIYLRYTQECEYEEIALLMNISVHSCRKLIYKAITKLRSSI